MPVRDWMTPNPITVEPHLPLVEAVSRMVQHGVKFLPVLEEGRLLGVLSGRSIIANLIGRDADPKESAQLPVWEFYDQVEPLTPGTEDHRAVEMMLACAFSLPVLEGDQLVGVVSQGNLLRFLAAELNETDQIASRRQVVTTRLGALLAVVRETSTSQDQNRILQVICRHLSSVMPVTKACLMLLPAQESTAFLQSVFKADGSRWQGHTQSVPLAETFSGWVFSQKTSLRVSDLKRVTQLHDYPEEWNDGSGASLSVPLVDEGQALGLLHFWSARAGSYLDSDLELLELVAGHVTNSILFGRRLEIENQLVQQLKRTNRIKDEFLAVVTHDLRNALQGILANTQLLERMARDDATTSQMALRVIESARYMADLTNDLHDLGRLGLEALKLTLRQVELDEMVERVLHENRNLAELHGLDLRFKKSPDNLSLRADPLRLRQILANLVSNAIKYNRPQGWVEVRTKRIGDQALVEVEDSGVGIEPHEQQRIFDLFHQAASSRKVQGSGLGLTITRRLVSLHKGRLEVTSRVGEGSLFRVRLPLSGPGRFV